MSPSRPPFLQNQPPSSMSHTHSTILMTTPQINFKYKFIIFISLHFHIKDVFQLRKVCLKSSALDLAQSLFLAHPSLNPLFQCHVIAWHVQWIIETLLIHHLTSISNHIVLSKTPMKNRKSPHRPTTSKLGGEGVAKQGLPHHHPPPTLQSPPLSALPGWHDMLTDRLQIINIVHLDASNHKAPKRIRLRGQEGLLSPSR
jgi:hypothetical protein